MKIKTRQNSLTTMELSQDSSKGLSDQAGLEIELEIQIKMKDRITILVDKEMELIRSSNSLQLAKETIQKLRI